MTSSGRRGEWIVLPAAPITHRLSTVRKSPALRQKS